MVLISVANESARITLGAMTADLKHVFCNGTTANYEQQIKHVFCNGTTDNIFYIPYSCNTVQSYVRRP